MAVSLTELLGIELPIIQAPMAGVQSSALAIAVCNAGGLGSLPCAMLTLEGLHQELSAITAATDKPYNLNFFCHTPPVVSEEANRAWKTSLKPYFDEYDIDADSIATGAGRAPFSAEIADVLEDFRPRVVSFHFGLPAPELLSRVKSWGSLVLSSATTVEEARWLEAEGADAVIAQGIEAGGHRGMFLSEDLSTQCEARDLLEKVIEAVNLPVIAAGGIADAQGVAATIGRGAAAVQIGTAYLLCPEASTSAIHRKALQSEAANKTALTNVFTGRPARGIVNRIMREQGSMSAIAPAFPLAANAIAPLRAKAESMGSSDFTPLWAGQNASACRELPAAELTRQLAAKL